MKKVLIIFGGKSNEHKVSCKSVNFIIENIDRNLFNYTLVGIDFKNNWYEIKKNSHININWKNNTSKKVINVFTYLKKFDIVLNMIHGATGEDGKMQSLFELFNIKYVGCNSYTSLVCYDKLLTKLILEKYKINQIPFIIYNNNKDLNKIKYPAIIKPCKSGSSIGISVVNDYIEAKNAIKKAKKYDNNIIIEKYIKNKIELECAILENEEKLIVSNIGEIITNGNFYDYKLKYKIKTLTKISTIDIRIQKEVKNISKMIFKILKCKGFSRLDFLYDKDSNKLYFNEINTIPGFTKSSMFPKLMKDYGIDYKSLINILLLS